MHIYTIDYYSVTKGNRTLSSTAWMDHGEVILSETNWSQKDHALHNLIYS